MAKPEKIRLKRARWHVGIRIMADGTGLIYEPFRARGEVTEADYGHTYMLAWGPFRSKEAACVAAKYGRGNPHMQTVADVENVVRHWKAEGFEFDASVSCVDYTKGVKR